MKLGKPGSWWRAADRRVGGGVKSDVEMRAVGRPKAGRTELVILSDTTFMGRLGELGQPIIRRKANTTPGGLRPQPGQPGQRKGFNLACGKASSFRSMLQPLRCPVAVV